MSDLPTQPATPQRTDPADPVGSTAAAAPPPQPIEKLMPVGVIIERIASVREQKPDEWNVTRVQVRGSGDAVVVGRHPGRRSLMIRSLPGSATCRVSPRGGASGSPAGFPLAAGETFKLDTTAPVIAACDNSGDVAELVVVVEYDSTVERRG